MWNLAATYFWACLMSLKFRGSDEGCIVDLDTSHTVGIQIHKVFAYLKVFFLGFQEDISSSLLHELCFIIFFEVLDWLYKLYMNTIQKICGIHNLTQPLSHLPPKLAPFKGGMKFASQISPLLNYYYCPFPWLTSPLVDYFKPWPEWTNLRTLFF